MYLKYIKPLAESDPYFFCTAPLHPSQWALIPKSHTRCGIIPSGEEFQMGSTQTLNAVSCKSSRQFEVHLCSTGFSTQLILFNHDPRTIKRWHSSSVRAVHVHGWQSRWPLTCTSHVAFNFILRYSWNYALPILGPCGRIGMGGSAYTTCIPCFRVLGWDWSW